MTTAPTPSRAEELAQWLEQDWDAMGVPELLDVAKELRRLQADHERLSAERATRMQQNDRMAARIAELEGKVGRFQGVPLPLIEAINAATGSNDWQGDKSPAELLEPACRAIAELKDKEEFKPDWAGYRQGLEDGRAEELEARKPLPPDALADKCEAWLQAGGAANIVDAFEAGYRAAEESS